MVAKVFLLLLVVAAEYTLALGNHRNYSYSYSYNFRGVDDVCLQDCNEQCDESCIEKCATRIIGRLGELLHYRDDKCVQECRKDCSSSCNQKCVTRNSRQFKPILPVRIYRNHSRQEKPYSWSESWNNRNDIYRTRNSTRQLPLRIDDVCNENCNKNCAERCHKECDSRGGVFSRVVFRNNACTEKCSSQCLESCAATCVSRRDNRRPRYNSLTRQVIPDNNWRPDWGNRDIYRNRNSTRQQSLRGDDACTENCKKECNEKCSKECVTRGIGRLGELLLYRDDICIENCDKDCSNSCTKKCVTRNSRVEQRFRMTYRNNSKQDTPYSWSESWHNRGDIYHTRNSTRLVPAGGYRNNSYSYSYRDDLCLHECREDGHKACKLECAMPGTLDASIPYIDELCIKSCEPNYANYCNEKCNTRNSKLEQPFRMTYRNNSKQDTPYSWSESWHTRDNIYHTRNSARQQSVRGDDACTENCKKDCGEKCTTECYTRGIGRLSELLLYRTDKCMENCNKDCSSSCTQQCITRNSKQDPKIVPVGGYRNNSYSYSYGYSYRDDLCLPECRKEADLVCNLECKIPGTLDELDELCLESCEPYYVNYCNEKCNTRNSKLEQPFRMTYRNNSKQDTPDNWNDLDDYYHTRNSTRQQNLRGDDACTENCKNECGEKCSKVCVTRGIGRLGELLLYRDDTCIESCNNECSSSCTQECNTRNSRVEQPFRATYRKNNKQDTPYSWSESWHNRGDIYHTRNSTRQQSLRGDDVCTENCNQECGEKCSKECVTRGIGRLGELLLYRDDKCIESCNKDCTSSCTKKCNTRNSRIEPPLWATYRKNNKQDTPYSWSESWHNRGDIYHTRNSTRQQSLRGGDACTENCNQVCSEKCSKECVTRGIGRLGELLLYRDDICLERCNNECSSSCTQECNTRNSKQLPPPQINWKSYREDVCLHICNSKCDDSCIQQCVNRGVDNGWVFTHFPRNNNVCIDNCKKDCSDNCDQACLSRRDKRETSLPIAMVS